MPHKPKSLALHGDLTVTCSLCHTADNERQHAILTEIAGLVDAGRLRSTQSEAFGPIDATNLARAYALIESGRAKGKVVLQGFGA